MSIDKRIFKDKSGKIFIPMNIDGGYLSETSFFNSIKLIVMGVMIFVLIIYMIWVTETFNGIVTKIFMLLIMLFVLQLIFRFYILEEKYFYRMYNIMKRLKITESDIFWNIANINDTENGAKIIYADMKIGVIVRVERDTIVGKKEYYKQVHFEALSDFYKSMNYRNLHFVQMNLMEHAGNDPRISNLEELINKTDNPNLASLMEMKIGFIRNIARETLYETDYFLIYTDKISRADYIIDDVMECANILLNGGFSTYEILDSHEIIELHKHLMGIKYFDYNKATLRVYGNTGIKIDNVISIKEIHFTNGEKRELEETEINRIRELASGVESGSINYSEVSIKDTLNSIDNKEKKEVEGTERIVRGKKDGVIEDSVIEDGGKNREEEISGENFFEDLFAGIDIKELEEEYIDF